MKLPIKVLTNVIVAALVFTADFVTTKKVFASSITLKRKQYSKK
ncbi:hypothetical protein [Chlorogloeopsis sp. ULAP02]